MKKQRNTHNGPTLYGFHAVREAWLNPVREVDALFLTDQALRGFEDTLREAGDKGVRRPQPQVLDKDRLEGMLPRGAVHQGLALACRALPDIFIQDFIIRAETKGESLLLMLDQVTDPHNVGAIIRSAAAFGADGIVMQRKHAPELDGVLAKTACGGLEHMPVAFETNLSRALEELKSNGFFAYGLDERGEKTISALPKDGKRILVLGAEGPGMRRLVAENCDELVKLPTQLPIASLNVSNAAAVALYAVGSNDFL
ncbi:MAG: 23S rRNA (guanosine(2251)-2'-O)-methyltransferase RlmB [Alphaproteobacteria bacterium]|nr:23S rRNA (guanosine(2251)-2'-O)-methyltransferase RlmB [Alphaproteobacteria bacterium]